MAPRRAPKSWPRRSFRASSAAIFSATCRMAASVEADDFFYLHDPQRVCAVMIHAATAIILRHSDYGEADRIVSFLTAEHGHIKGFARSARSSRRRFGAALEPLAEVGMHWKVRPGRELVDLREADLINLHHGLRRDLPTLTLASYGCELAELLFGESGPAPELFALLQAFLNHLDVEGSSVEARLLFELRILELAGYVPHLQHCAACFGPLPEGAVGFSAASNGSLCPACGGDGLQIQVDRLTLGSLGRILRTPLTSFTGFRLSPRSRSEGQMVLAEAIARHLSRPPKSLTLLASLILDRQH
ncbi:MAG: DNA repair protein RecO [Desulfuromonas sp.]|nr:MAG: DNA repair protein RecO [Desulfuromonas sp.]